MTVQIPAFRLTVARLMAEHRTRLAERIDRELQKKGQNHTDLAVAVRVDPRTAERWIEGKTEPQRRLRKPVADYLDVPIEELWPDLEAAERALRDQLDRIEAEVAAMRKDQRKLIADLRVVLLEEFERGRAAMELPTPGQAPASDAPPPRSNRAKGRRATG